MVKTETLSISTGGNGEIHDITADVADRIRAAKLKNGTATVFVPGATGAVTTIEHETGLLRDMKELLDRLIPPEKEYHHNLRWGDGNGHSHLRASLLGPSLTVPVSDGAPVLGTWQQIIFIDFDNHARNRNLVVQLMGE